MNYSQKLRDPRWQQKRLEVFKRANWRCEECWRGDRELQAHHIFYIPGIEPWDYPDQLLVSLCAEHHEKRQRIEVQLFKNVAAIIRNMSIEEIREQPIWTMFLDGGEPIVTVFDEHEFDQAAERKGAA